MTAVLALALPGIALADTPVRIVTWNVEQGFSTDDIETHLADFRRAGKALRPDVLLLQEVTSQKVVRAIAAAMNLDGYQIGISDFNPDNHAEFASLEVAIVSRFPITEIEEHDAKPEPDDPWNVQLAPPNLPWLTPIRHTDRGFLFATIPELKLSLSVLHLKSSRGQEGQEDASNAEKRERVAAAVAAKVVSAMTERPDFTHVVAGDFNVGHADTGKNGIDPNSECFDNCDSQDLYDETHAIFHGGLIGGLQMTNLVGHTTQPTLPEFGGSPIDNIYVAGPAAGDFSDAVVVSDTFASDHTPVVTVYSAP
jgi:endonuclease/exonuclease/phosphatase family metal-dependent hydrolase